VGCSEFLSELNLVERSLQHPIVGGRIRQREVVFEAAEGSRDLVPVAEVDKSLYLRRRKRLWQSAGLATANTELHHLETKAGGNRKVFFQRKVSKPPLSASNEDFSRLTHSGCS
jgi:hypothetical protein